MINLHEEVSRLGRILGNQFESINSGGCCVVAALVANELQHFTKVRISSKAYEGRGKRIANNLIENGQGLNHVVCEFKYNNRWYVFDVDDYECKFATHEDYNDDRWTKDSLTIEKAMLAVESRAGWNFCFDRDQIPDIKEEIVNFFSHLEERVAA